MSKKEYAYGLRTCGSDRTSYNGFVWPKKGKVSAPDWMPTWECGNGLHALLNGEGDANLLSWDDDAVWQVVKFDAATMIELNGKVKFPECIVLHTGTRATTTAYLWGLIGAGHAIHGLILHSDGKLIANGGDGSTLTGGYGSTLTGGYGSTLTGGYLSTLTGGDRSTLTGGDRSTLTGGAGSCFTVVWWYDGKRRSASFNEGEDHEANTPYKAVCEGRNCRLEKVIK